MLLTVAYALAGGCCADAYNAASAQPSEASAAKYTGTEVFFRIIVLGNIFACPIILAAQYLFRRRRTLLSEGEWLWLCPMALWTTWMAITIIEPTEGFLILWFLTVALTLICSCLSLVCISFRLCGIWGFATCHWTDAFGCLTCLSVGLWLWYELVAHPLVLKDL
jgi:hypothetical protein